MGLLKDALRPPRSRSSCGAAPGTRVSLQLPRPGLSASIQLQLGLSASLQLQPGLSTSLQLQPGLSARMLPQLHSHPPSPYICCTTALCSAATLPCSSPSPAPPPIYLLYYCPYALLPPSPAPLPRLVDHGGAPAFLQLEALGIFAAGLPEERNASLMVLWVGRWVWLKMRCGDPPGGPEGAAGADEAVVRHEGQELGGGLWGRGPRC